jgi:hypothetical protein
MADGREQAPAVSIWTLLTWTNIFRCFQVALDPRKLLLAAAGILVMSFGWYVLSAMFYYKAPTRDDQDYSNAALSAEFGDRTKPGTNEKYKEEDLRAEGDRRFQADHAQWVILADLAGPGGRLRTMPWYETRGQNPFLFVTQLISSPATTWWDQVKGYATTVTPVLIEPLVKLLLPVAKLVSPGVSFQTRFYLLLVVLWTLAVWGFFGGVITRIAAVQLANKGPITIRQAIQFVATRYVSYLLAPVVPLVIIAVVVLGLILYGVLGLIPVLGDLVFLGLGLPLIIAAGAVMALFLVGLVGYPLMYTTLSVEGDSSDTFDALSRSINYVYQAPWNYIWYWIVAVVYGALVTFFILFFCSLMVYMGKWAVGLTASAVWTDRKPDYLFIYAPESFGWRELMLKDSPYAVRQEIEIKEGGRAVPVYKPVNPTLYEQNRKEFMFYNTWGAGLVCFWLTLLFLMMLGFSYSFFWSAATMIYLLMRQKVDESELDEVFFEEEEPEAPLPPPKIAEGTGPAPANTSLPVITPPAPPVVSSPPVVPPTPPSTTLPYNGPAAPPPAEPGPTPRTDEDRPTE